MSDMDDKWRGLGECDWEGLTGIDAVFWSPRLEEHGLVQRDVELSVFPLFPPSDSQRLLPPFPCAHLKAQGSRWKNYFSRRNLR